MMFYDMTSDYEKVEKFCRDLNGPEVLLQLTSTFKKGLWRDYWTMLESVPFNFEGKVIVDIGCKFGHTLPVFLRMGADRAIGVDVEPEYVEYGNKTFKPLYPYQIEIVSSDQGLIPIQPETVDFCLVNEVISHVNPDCLERLYSEIVRILKVGGGVFISDGNNFANRNSIEKLFLLWEKWENGPEGVHTDRDVVDKSFKALRREIISEKFNSLTAEETELLATNTSGLYGETLIKVADEYVKNRKLIRRPYRKGVYSTSPRNSGSVMERAFRPTEVKFALAQYGIECDQHLPLPRSLKSRFKQIIKRSALSLIKPSWRESYQEGYQILGIKKY